MAETCENSLDARQRDMESVVRAYQQPLLRYAARLLRNATLAQDVVQNVFIALFRHWQPLQKAGDKLKPWLFRVTHNEAVSLIRHEERKRGLHRRGADEARLTDGCAHHDGAPDERHAIVLECLHKLSPQERQVILLRLQQGLSYDEIAEATGRPRGTVGALLHTAVKKLAIQVQKKEAL